MYHELFPPRELEPFLECLWVHAVSPTQHTQMHRVLPDGCVDLISGLHGEPTVVGPMTRHALIPIAPGTVIVGARFRPGTAPAFLRCASNMLLDSEHEVSAVLPGLDVHSLEDGSVAKRLERLRRILVNRLDDSQPDWMARVSADQLRKQPTTSVASLSRSLGVSERQLLRRFEAGVGYPPSFFRRVVRLQRLAHLPRVANQSTNLARVALETGYADQAHMNRDVRQLAGLTPKEFLGA